MADTFTLEMLDECMRLLDDLPEIPPQLGVSSLVLNELIEKSIDYRFEEGKHWWGAFEIVEMPKLPTTSIENKQDDIKETKELNAIPNDI